jgi:uncharacterized protein (TIGR00661 family)
LKRQKRILVTPLDWGLGHATRCIPVIHALLQRGCEVYIAGTGAAIDVLKKEFPRLTFLFLPAYNPVYPKNGNMVWGMGRQLIKFLRIINEEHRQLQQLITKFSIDIIISDNRYGCYSNKAKSILITHQLNILMPVGYGLLQRIVNKFNHRQIKKFNACWVPDLEGRNSIAGNLSEKVQGIKLQYIGPLCRLKKSVAEKKYDALVLLSGPEPQRSILFDLLKEQATKSTTLNKIKLVEGLPGKRKETVEGKIDTVNYLHNNELAEAIAESKVVICRSGYSTIMDLMQVGGKAIFIPTPGQTEQEYLAKNLKEKGIAYYMPQNEFNLDTALTEYNKYSGFSAATTNNQLLMQAIDHLLQ